MKTETTNIHVVLADRTYPLKVEVGEEEIVRKAAKFVNDKMKELKKKYDVKDRQDYLAMCALQLAVEHLKHKNEIVEEKSFVEKLDELDNVLTDFLKK